MSGAAEVVREVISRLGSGDESVLDELVAENYVNHAATPQGREGWRAAIRAVGHALDG